MFSVDNFYEFFKVKYGWDKHQVLPFVPTMHGTKDFSQWVRWHDINESQKNNVFNYSKYSIHGAIILHDQEPFWSGLLDIYCADANSKFNDCLSIGSTEDYFLRRWQTCSWPIFCHSEKNSDDIEWLKSIGVIDCHYFYHGLISRDWFRHWKHHPDLSPKSTWQKRFLLYIRDASGSRQYRNQVKQDLLSWREHIHHNWDHPDPKITSDYSAKIIVEDAIKTGIHIVAETVFDNKKIHLTEKVFKPIVMCQPFIIYAAPQSLRYMKSYGFQTFSSIWDESYDQESNHDRRREMIHDLIGKLCRLDDSEFCTVLEKCQKIIEHNRDHFYSEDFEKILLKELDINVLTAYQQQKELLKNDPGGSFFFTIDQLFKKGMIIDEKAHATRRVTDTLTHLENIVNELKTNHLDKWQLIKSKYPWAETIF